MVLDVKKETINFQKKIVDNRLFDRYIKKNVSNIIKKSDIDEINDDIEINIDINITVKKAYDNFS